MAHDIDYEALLSSAQRQALEVDRLAAVRAAEQRAERLAVQLCLREDELALIGAELDRLRAATTGEPGEEAGERDRDQLRAELDALAREEQAARREAGRLRSDLEDGRRAREDLEGRLEGLRAELAAAAGEIERQRAARASTERELAGQAAARLAAERAAEAERRLRDDFAAANDALTAEVERLRASLAAAEHRHERALTEHRGRIRQLEQTASALGGVLRQTQDDIERAAASRAWRYGHALTTAAARARLRKPKTRGALAAALARIERLDSALRSSEPAALPPVTGTEALQIAGSGPGDGSLAAHLAGAASVLPLPDREQAAVERGRGALAERLRERFGPAPELERWPPVTVIVVTRNGRHHLERLLDGLIRFTDYADVELIVVDNASTDDTLAYLDEVHPPFRLQTIVNDRNRSFAEANAQGAAEASGELLLFVNNDIEPFESGWLRELVAAHAVAGVAAAGATLLHAEPPGAPADAPWIVQHRSVRFRWQDGMVKGFNVGDGEPLWAGAFGIEPARPR